MNDKQGSQGQSQTVKLLRVVVVDDHPMIRQGVKCTVDHESDMQLVGEAEGGNQVEHVIRDLIEQDTAPDVVVMDISMPDGNGAEATALIRRCFPQVRVLVLSMHEESFYLSSLIESGASGYVSKRSTAEELIRAIRVVASGAIYVDPALMNTALKLLFRSDNTTNTANTANRIGEVNVSDGLPLSVQEEKVLRRIAEGYTNKEIGIQLGIATKTVETYRSRAMEKLCLNGRVELVRYAVMHGWLT